MAAGYSLPGRWVGREMTRASNLGRRLENSASHGWARHAELGDRGGGFRGDGGRVSSAERHNSGYTVGMKTAISILDSLFEAGERVAKHLGISRSELYKRAIASFIADKSDTSITAELDLVYQTRESVVNVSQLLTLDRCFLVERVRPLNTAPLKQIEEGLELVLNLSSFPPGKPTPSAPGHSAG